MIRVLHVVTGSMSRAGLETFIMSILRNIDKENVKFDFLLNNPDVEGDYHNEIKNRGGKLYYIKSDTSKNYISRNILRYSLLKKFFSKHQGYNTIHIHASSYTRLLELYAAYKAGIKNRIVHSHNTTAKNVFFHKLLYRFMRYFSTYRFACSEEAGEWMFGKKFKHIKNSKVINNGINTDIFYYDKDKQKRLKKKYNVENKLVIGHVGRFSKVKNHDFIVDVFSEVHKNNKKAILFLIGDGELRQEVEEKVKEYNLDNYVKFTGVRSDISDLLLVMDVMLFPSFHEGLPVSLIEAQSTGLKIIASDSVSKNANLTGLIKYISLNKSAIEWSKVLLKESNYNRKNQVKVIKKNNYDIGGIASELCKIYK